MWLPSGLGIYFISRTIVGVLSSVMDGEGLLY